MPAIFCLWPCAPQMVATAADDWWGTKLTRAGFKTGATSPAFYEFFPAFSFRGLLPTLSKMWVASRKERGHCNLPAWQKVGKRTAFQNRLMRTRSKQDTTYLCDQAWWCFFFLKKTSVIQCKKEEGRTGISTRRQ